ncbi:MAG: hypothetical protein HOP11_14405 [Saprospiraceae bacterium]|nr:hypothetical protein [Saprospiraceae bacterium]
MKTLSSTFFKAHDFIFVISIIFICCNPTYDHPSDGKVLPINCIPQEQSLWCWAACTEMVIKHIDPSNNITQCDQAYRSMPQNACCTTNPCCYRQMDSECNHTNWPIFDQYGFSCKDTYTHSDFLSWKKMLLQIDNDKPMCLTYNFHGAGAHMIVMSGYKIVDGDLELYLIDPYSSYNDNQVNPVEIRFVPLEFVRSDYRHELGRCYYDIYRNNSSLQN